MITTEQDFSWKSCKRDVTNVSFKLSLSIFWIFFDLNEKKTTCCHDAWWEHLKQNNYIAYNYLEISSAIRVVVLSEIKGKKGEPIYILVIEDNQLLKISNAEDSFKLKPVHVLFLNLITVLFYVYLHLRRDKCCLLYCCYYLFLLLCLFLFSCFFFLAFFSFCHLPGKKASTIKSWVSGPCTKAPWWPETLEHMLVKGNCICSLGHRICV